MKLLIPKFPKTLDLVVDHRWDGEPCPDPLIRADVHLSQTVEGIRVVVEALILSDAKIPEAQPGSRVANLWEYDVVEVFFVGPGHHYLEIELGSHGHWLALGFNEVRQHSDEYETWKPDVRWSQKEKTWQSEVIVPFEMIPSPLRALSAFVIVRGEFLSLVPMPGKEANFHQPDAYPEAHLA